MKRAAIAVLALLAATLLAAPCWFGLQTEKAYRSPGKPSWEPAGATFTLRTFERGWLGSRAVTVVMIDAAALGVRWSQLQRTHLAPPPALVFTIDDSISHGPVPLAEFRRGRLRLLPVRAIITSTITPDAPTRTFLSELLGQAGPLSFTRTVALRGEQELLYRSPAGTVGIPLSWRGSGVAGATSFPLLWKNLRVAASSEPDGGTVRFALRATVDELSADGRRYGPGACDLEIRNLGAAVLEEMPRERQEIPPEIEITRLSLETEHGVIRGSARLRFTGSAPPAAGSPSNGWRALADAEAEVAIAPGLLTALMESQIRRNLAAAPAGTGSRKLSDEEIDRLAEPRSQQQIQALLALNYLVKEGENYRLSLRYSAGRLTLNGLPLRLGPGGA